MRSFIHLSVWLCLASPVIAETTTASIQTVLQGRSGDWRSQAGLIVGQGDLDNRYVFPRPAPPSYSWPVTIDLRAGWSAGVLVGCDADGKHGYSIRLDSRQPRIALDKIGPWPEVQELATFPWKPGDGAKLHFTVVADRQSIRVYWPERSVFPILEALGAPAGDHTGLQVLDGKAAFLCAPPVAAAVNPLVVHVPKAGDYRHVYNPSVGESGPWYINDHCFAQGPDGWHLFGITRAQPADPMNEILFAHARSPAFPGSLETWKKQPPALQADASSGERHLWAPHVIRKDGLWHMFYCAGSPEGGARYRMHLATSEDLSTWTRHSENPLFEDTFDARDPMVLKIGDAWHMYYTANMGRGASHHTVHLRTSRDLLRWSPASIAFVHPAVGTGAGPTESPFVVPYGDHFYLFIGPAGDYHRTAIYRSSNPLWWEPKAEIGSVPSHAAEIIRDEQGAWHVSDCGWDREGVYLAPLTWEKVPPPQ